MSKAGHRHRNHPTFSTSSWQKCEVPTFIDKPPVEKQKVEALFFDGLQRIIHWCLHWYKLIIKCCFTCALMKNSIASVAEFLKKETTPGLPIIGSEWTFRNAERNKWTSIWNWGYSIQRTSHNLDQTHKPFDGLAFSTKKQNHSRHASGKTHFYFLFHATQACGQRVLQH